MRTTIAAWLVLLSAASSARAIDVPQTREAFVAAVAGGAGMTKVETILSDRPLDAIYALLEEKTAACLDAKVNRTAYVGYVERSSTDYNPSLRRVAQDRAEFTLQVEHNPRGVGATPPAGGLYFMAADLRSIDAGHTEIVLYRPSMGVKGIVESLKEWFDGEPSPCPKLK